MVCALKRTTACTKEQRNSWMASVHMKNYKKSMPETLLKGREAVYKAETYGIK